MNVVFRVGSNHDSVRAVDQLSLTMPAGQITSLVGASGCGKTTLLRTIAGLQPPTSGNMTLQPPAKAEDGDISFVFQQPALLPWRTAWENVMLPLTLLSSGNNAPSKKEDIRHIAREALTSVELGDALDRLPHQLSGGMQMRVSIARALVTNPRVLLLDEPFAALDDMLRTQLGQLLLKLWHQHQFTAVMVTHNIGEAVLLSHHVAVMSAGRCENMFENELPWPRDEDQRRTPLFGKCYGVIMDALRGATEDADRADALGECP